MPEAVRIEGTNKKRKVDRCFFARCHACEAAGETGARIDCPPDINPWAWARRGEVIDFLRDHRAKHGSDRVAGVEMIEVEKDEGEP